MNDLDMDRDIERIRGLWSWKGFAIGMSLFIYNTALWIALIFPMVVWPDLPLEPLIIPLFLVDVGFMLFGMVCVVFMTPHTSRFTGVSKGAPDPVRYAHLFRAGFSDMLAALRLEWLRKLFRGQGQ